MNLRDSARGEDCTLNIADCCCYQTETVVLCHVRDFHGGGTSLKPDDLCGVYGCDPCHRTIDRRDPVVELTPADRMFYIARALYRTHKRMRERGLLTRKAA